MAHPRFSSRAPNDEHRQRRYRPGVQPSQGAPVRVSNFKEADRQKQGKRTCRDENGDRVDSIALRFPISNFPRTIFPSQPKKIERKKWNEPAVVILFVDRPFTTELAAENEPQCAKRQQKQTPPRH